MLPIREAVVTCVSDVLSVMCRARTRDLESEREENTMNAPRPSSVDLQGYGLGLRLYEPTWFGPLPDSFQLETDGNGILLAAWPAGDVENLFLVPDTDSGPVDLPLPHERRGSVTLGSSYNSSDTQRFGEFFEFPDVPIWLIRYGAFEFTMPDAMHKVDAGRLEITKHGLEPDEFVSFDGPYLPQLGPTFDELIAQYEAVGQRVLGTGTVKMGRGTAQCLMTQYENDGQRWRQLVHLCTDGIAAIVRGQYLEERDDDVIGTICDEVVGTLQVDRAVAEAAAEL